MKRVLAFDFGASSGRAMLATFENGKINMEEIHRFTNDPVMVNGTFYWDVLRLFFEIKAGITKAVNNGGFDCISIDTWGVDFGLINKKGDLLVNPVHYRDNRTIGMEQEVFKIIPKDELYSMCGTQCMHFNTIYQLMYLKLNEPQLLEQAEHMLLMPDLFAYMLTGEIKDETSIISTTNLFDPVKCDWNFNLIERLGFPKKLFSPCVKSGEIYGYLTDEICEELGCDKVPVVAVAGHDTASAVAATPSLTDDFVYISCGTWSLFGIEKDTPVLTREAMEANFTNEGGFKDTIRFLKNIMGLWLIQESRRQWRREGEEVGFDTLEREALQSEPFKCFIDVDNAAFETAGNLPKRVKEFCERTGQYVPKNRGEVMRCIYQSLTMKYKYTFEALKKIGNRDYKQINILGGGIKDKLLCQMTANACNVDVLAGPTEATVIGNIGVALYAMGEIESFKHLRQVTTASTEIKTYSPVENDSWEKAYKDYLKVIGK